MTLMLLLPLQGLAVASMLEVTHAPQPAAVEQMAMAEHSMAACHVPAKPDAPAPSHTDCKHCSACVLASALPVPAAKAMPLVPIVRSFASQPDASYSGFVPDGPERPPRSILA